jgi:uncharacterized protein
MNGNKRKILIRALKIILSVYGVSGIVLWHLQEKILFHPTPLSTGYKFSFQQPNREYLIPLTEDSRLSFVRFFPTDTQHVKGVVLYFHGNRENINRYARFAGDFTAAGYEVWMMDYPGYGKSTGALTEERLYSDADQIYRMAAKRISSDSILIYGKSLGTGIASELASRRNCKRLLLETPYYSMPALAMFHFPIFPAKRMLRYQLPTYACLPQVKAPVTIFQGTKDRIIPYRHAKRLLPLLKPGDEFVTIEMGSHNNLADFPYYHMKLRALL